MNSSKLFRILVIEDNPKESELYKQLLLDDNSNNYDIIEAEDIEQALGYCNILSIDCIVLDFNLPGSDSLEFLVDVESQFGRIHWPIVLLGEDESESSVAVVEALKRGAEEYLSKKHISQENLSRSINSAMNSMNAKRHEESVKHELIKENENLKKEVAELKKKLGE